MEEQKNKDREQVLQVLRDCYGVLGVELEFLAQGYSHKSYTFETPILAGKVVVKISHPNKMRDEEDIVFESLVTDFLADHAYPVQNSYKSLRGRYFERTQDGRSVQVLKYLDAVKPRKPKPKQKIYESGELLARFHKITKNFKVERYCISEDLIKRRTFFLRKRLDALRNNLMMYQYVDTSNLQNSGLSESIKFLLNEHRKINFLLTKRRKNLLPKYVIHGDYNPGNIIFKGSSVSGVIDFEHCGFGPIYWDIGFAIAHWSFIMNSYGVDRITKYFMEGYNLNTVRLSTTLVKAFRSFSALWRLSDAIRYYDKYKNKTHWENEVRYYIKKCKMLAM